MISVPRILRGVFSFASRRAGAWRAKRGRHAVPPPHTSNAERTAEHADERTIRHTAEEQLGGKSSTESREAYVRGDNPGGLHRGGHGPAPREREDDDIAADPADPTGATVSPLPPGHH